MKSLVKRFKFIIPLVLILSLVSIDDQAQAQGGMGAWVFDATINPGVTPLEISGGGVFPDVDTFIVLNQEDLANLHVYNINRETRSLQSSSTIPVNTPAFGLSHNIRATNPGPNPTAHSCFVDNFQLYAVHSQNAVDWDKLLVTNDTSFSSCDTAVDNGNVFVGACNFGADEYRVYQSADNGQTWNLIETIENVLCAFEGGTRANFNRIDGESVVFYMSSLPAVALATNDLLEVRGGFLHHLVVEDDDGPFVVDQDFEGPPLAESYPGGAVGDFIITPYYHRDSNTVNIIVSNLKTPGFDFEHIVLGPGPEFNQFFGITCVEGPEGTVNIMYPGGFHFQYNTETGEVSKIPDAPFTNPDGPIAASIDEVSARLMRESLMREYSVGYQGDSFDYAQFRIILDGIPTLSEWGLIALAGILGIVGFMVIRRRKVTA